MIYSEAPHQPLMRAFTCALEAIAKSITISTTPVMGDALACSHLYVLESHPAVAMGFWRVDNRFENTMAKIPRYKGTLKGTEYEGMTSDSGFTLLWSFRRAGGGASCG